MRCITGVRAARCRRPALGIAAAVLIAAALPAPASAGHQFHFRCSTSHAAPDDPIVHPGRPGAAHLHDFFGATSTNAFSTRESLRASQTTCEMGNADTSAYWLPALLERQGDSTFRHVRPDYSVVYYHASHPGKHVEAFPPGFRMIAGDQRARSPQPTTLARWQCYGGSPVGDGTRPHCIDDPAQPGAPKLRLDLTFPDCWDGRLDSPDHRSHVRFAANGVCPGSHSRRIPQIKMFTFYNSPGGPDADLVPIPGAVRLSSGGQFSIHADFMEAWDTAVLQTQLERCFLPDAQVCSL